MRVGKAGGELRLLGRAPTQLGQTLTVAIDGHEHKVNLPLIGAYQGANALISAALVIATGASSRFGGGLSGRASRGPGHRSMSITPIRPTLLKRQLPPCDRTPRGALS